MQICTNCHTQSQDSSVNCENCGADLRELSTTSVALKKMQGNSRVSYVLISVSNDRCPACRDLQGAYAKDAVPSIPVEGCSHDLGCRCFYQPTLEEIYP